jgi:hypothetical protein
MMTRAGISQRLSCPDPDRRRLRDKFFFLLSEEKLQALRGPP